MVNLTPSASSVKIHFHISDFDTYYIYTKGSTSARRRSAGSIKSKDKVLYRRKYFNKLIKTALFLETPQQYRALKVGKKNAISNVFGWFCKITSKTKINIFWNLFITPLAPLEPIHSKIFQKTLLLAFEANSACVVKSNSTFSQFFFGEN